MGADGRVLLTMAAEVPPLLRTTMALTRRSLLSWAVQRPRARRNEMECGRSGCSPRAAGWRKPVSSDCQPSTLRQIRFMVRTVSTGYLPFAVSAESITASAPANTAVETSEASARVGRGWETIDSSICVATITGLALLRALSMMSANGLSGKILVVLGREDVVAARSFANLVNVTTLDAGELNAYDVLNAD